MAECVLVTDKEFSKAKVFFESTGMFKVKIAPTNEQALADAVIANGCRAVIVGVSKYTGQLYEALGKTSNGRGAIIVRYGVGHDGVDKKLARKHHIVVTNTHGVLDQSVAEHAIWLMGAMARKIVKTDAKMRAGEFDPQMGMEVSGKTLGIVGFGTIGKRVAKIAHFGFDMKILAADVVPCDTTKIEKLKRDFGIDMYTNDVDLVLGQADIVSIHLPSIPETHHFFNADRLAAMKLRAMLVNTSRGSIIDECALYDALIGGQLAGAALDVYESEPYKPVRIGKDLRSLSNVVLTPHTGSDTAEANCRMAEMCIENIRRFIGERSNLIDLAAISD